MAFNTATSAARSSNNNEAWKASAFINIYLPRKNGGKMKLGAIPLRESSPNEKTLFDWIQQDPEKNMEKILNSLIMDFTPSISTSIEDLDL